VVTRRDIVSPREGKKNPRASWRPLSPLKHLPENLKFGQPTTPFSDSKKANSEEFLSISQTAYMENSEEETKSGEISSATAKKNLSTMQIAVCD